MPSSYIHSRELKASDVRAINNTLFPIVDIFVNRKLTLAVRGGGWTQTTMGLGAEGD